MEEKNNNKISRFVAAVSFTLLLLVVFLTFLRPVLHKNPTPANVPQDSQNIPEQTAPKMTPKELFQKTSAGEPINILDIRSSDAFQKEHLQNSRNVPPENVASLLEKNKFYVIVDDGNSGLARNLAANLNKNGTTVNIYYLDGGFQDWKTSNFPAISEGNPNSIVDQSKVSYISPDDLKNAMQNEENGLAIVDVRNSDIFSFEHLKNALNIPLPDIEKRSGEISSGKKIILYDNNGKLSFQAAARLFDLSIFNAYILSGGLDAWKQKGYEIINTNNSQ
jgi:rhodanese-related sulfurtransferase